ncbi:MAG: type II secretion system protein N [Betaproteobacteria bacterium]|nr:type II secretion system protein N [Betaproteobacteria bacterium]
MRSQRPAPAAPSSSRADWGWAVLGLVVGLVGTVVYQAPARWLSPLVARSGYLQLFDTQGTLWSGSGRLLLTAGAGSRDKAALPDRIEWRWSMSGDGILLDLNARCCMVEPLRLSLTLSGGKPKASLSDQHSIWPAEPLAGLGTPMNTLKPSGSLHLRTQGIHWLGTDRTWHGRASLEARHVASTLSSVKPLGQYRIDWVGGPAPSLQLSTLDGPLMLQAEGRWQAGRLRLTGQASSTPEMEPILGPILNLIGRREGTRSLLSIG